MIICERLTKMNKVRKKITGVDLSTLEIGKNAKVLCCGEWLLTSPVINYCKHGGVVIIETKNSIYSTK